MSLQSAILATLHYCSLILSMAERVCIRFIEDVMINFYKHYALAINEIK